MTKGTGGGRAPRKRACHVDQHCLEDLRYWVSTQARVADRVLQLMDAILKDPFEGIGKPEPLKHLGPNIWSRRLTQEHRLVYMVFDDKVVFLQARYHY